MGEPRRSGWKAGTALVLMASLPLSLLPVPAAGQSGGTIVSVTAIGPDEYQITRLMACPVQLTGGFLGFIFGYVHQGYEWTDRWQRDRVLDPIEHSLAEYVPLGDPSYIVSRDGKARWVAPRLTVRCTVTEVWRAGRIISARDSYRVILNGGIVQECGGSGGSAWYVAPEEAPYDPDYNPYAKTGSGEDDEACTTLGGGGDGGGASGTPYLPGDNTGGETVDWGTGTGTGGPSACGSRAVVEYVCIDVWVEGVGWVEWGCGYVTTC